MQGVLNVIKPTGLTSSDVVVRVRKLLGIKKVGHLGTLDPAASGVLPVAVGDATKLFDFYLKKRKKYRVVVKFGVKTTTLDSDGEVLETDDVCVLQSDLNRILPKFLGSQMQTPPIYSAVHIEGKRAYALAKSNIHFEIPKRCVHIYAIDFVSCLASQTFLLDIECSAGTYIRSLLEDIAIALHTHATMLALIRLQSGEFSIEQAYTLHDIEKNPKGCMLSINSLFASYTQYVCTEKEYKDFIQGKQKEFFFVNKEMHIVLMYCNKVIALLQNVRENVYIAMVKFLKEVEYD